MRILRVPRISSGLVTTGKILSVLTSHHVSVFSYKLIIPRKHVLEMVIFVVRIHFTRTGNTTMASMFICTIGPGRPAVLIMKSRNNVRRPRAIVRLVTLYGPGTRKIYAKRRGLRSRHGVRVKGGYYDVGRIFCRNCFVGRSVLVAFQHRHVRIVHSVFRSIHYTRFSVNELHGILDKRVYGDLRRRYNFTNSSGTVRYTGSHVIITVRVLHGLVMTVPTLRTVCSLCRLFGLIACLGVNIRTYFLFNSQLLTGRLIWLLAGLFARYSLLQGRFDLFILRVTTVLLTILEPLIVRVGVTVSHLFQRVTGQRHFGLFFRFSSFHLIREGTSFRHQTCCAPVWPLLSVKIGGRNGVVFSDFPV